ncbi:MAG: NADH-quinone oxidoreductase subunit NuoE [Propionibacteriaceae bacterium]|jgi:NADH-quinone oxidoreductase subunit E|nr:NADH-quinone oxidoreductase subunit NuoE [Propionibacteriaceae bacterium]
MSEHELEYDFAGTGSVDMTDQSSAIDKAVIAQLTAIADRYPQKRSALMPMLHLVQSVDGRVSPRGIEVCAEIVGVTPAQVSGVATFYTMYKRRPAGKHHIGVCTTALCAVMGGDALLDAVQAKLGIGVEETTADGMFSLERIECNAACDFAPIMMVNWEFMDNMTPDKAEQLLDDLSAGREVRSSRGPVLTSWADTEKVLSGFDDGLADEGPSAGDPSLAGVRIASERHWSAVPKSTLAPAKSAEPAKPAGSKTAPAKAAEPASTDDSPKPAAVAKTTRSTRAKTTASPAAAAKADDTGKETRTRSTRTKATAAATTDEAAAASTKPADDKVKPAAGSTRRTK